MVIIGGLGSLIGSFFGAALIWILPILLRALPAYARAYHQLGAPSSTCSS